MIKQQFIRNVLLASLVVLTGFSSAVNVPQGIQFAIVDEGLIKQEVVRIARGSRIARIAKTGVVIAGGSLAVLVIGAGLLYTGKWLRGTLPEQKILDEYKNEKAKSDTLKKTQLLQEDGVDESVNESNEPSEPVSPKLGASDEWFKHNKKLLNILSKLALSKLGNPTIGGMLGKGQKVLQSVALVGAFIPMFGPTIISSSWKKHINGYSDVFIFAREHVNLLEAFTSLKEQSVMTDAARTSTLYFTYELEALAAEWDDCVERFERLIAFMDYNIESNRGLHFASAVSARKLIKRALDDYVKAISLPQAQFALEASKLNRALQHSLRVFALAMEG
jgi:hypothetical protein